MQDMHPKRYRVRPGCRDIGTGCSDIGAGSGDVAREDDDYAYPNGDGVTSKGWKPGI